jgi:hypothetical protein
MVCGAAIMTGLAVEWRQTYTAIAQKWNTAPTPAA